LGFDTALILTEEEMFLSLVLRIIFQVQPAVLSSSVSTPALALAYYASHMAFLGGDFRGGRQSGVHDLLTKMFLQTKVRDASQRKGWQRLCRMFLVGERALYLSGRRKGSHFAGHPDSVPRSLEQLLNPAGKDEWLSRRIVLRSLLNLWVVEDQRDGALTSCELVGLRERLLTSSGRALLMAAKITVLPGLDADGVPAADAWLKFDWSIPWVANSAPVALVRSLRSSLARAPHIDLTKVSAYHVAVPPPASGDAGEAGISLAAKRKRSTKGSGRPSSRTRAASPATPLPLCAPALSTAAGCVTCSVDACVAWPMGAWASQFPLPSWLDVAADGKVDLNVVLEPRVKVVAEKAAERVGEAVKFVYNLVITQIETSPTVDSLALGGRVVALPQAHWTSRSVEMVKALDRIAARVMGDPTRGIQARHSPRQMATTNGPLAPLRMDATRDEETTAAWAGTAGELTEGAGLGTVGGVEVRGANAGGDKIMEDAAADPDEENACCGAGLVPAMDVVEGFGVVDGTDVSEGDVERLRSVGGGPSGGYARNSLAPHGLHLPTWPSMSVLSAPTPPTKEVSASWSFSFGKPLSLTVVDCFRSAGRLWCVVPVVDPVRNVV